MDWQVLRVPSPLQAVALSWLASFPFNFGAAPGVKPRVSRVLISLLPLSHPFLNTATSEEDKSFCLRDPESKFKFWQEKEVFLWLL